MSGGLFNYKNEYLKNEIFDWCDGKKVPNVFEDREISELIYDVFELIHCFDLYKSGDTCKGTYLHQKNEFKIKWMGNRGVRVKRIVDAAISDVKQELYETWENGCTVEEVSKITGWSEKSVKRATAEIRERMSS